MEQGFEVHIATGTNDYWHEGIPLTRSTHWIARTIDQAVEQGATGAYNTNWEFYRGNCFDNLWPFQAVAAERAWSDAPFDFMSFPQRFCERFWGAAENHYAEIGRLSETITNLRRMAFLDGPVLEIPIEYALNLMWKSWRQAAFDFEELGAYMMEQARRMRQVATRQRSSLRMLDLPGLAVWYVGVRAHQRVRLEQAQEQGALEDALQCVNAIRQAARHVARRLDAGLRIYGSGVRDRDRIAAHLAQLDAITARLGVMSVDDLRRTPIESW